MDDGFETLTLPAAAQVNRIYIQVSMEYNALTTVWSATSCEMKKATTIPPSSVEFMNIPVRDVTVAAAESPASGFIISEMAVPAVISDLWVAREGGPDEGEFSDYWGG
jgi:hypothetical protein